MRAPRFDASLYKSGSHSNQKGGSQMPTKMKEMDTQFTGTQVPFSKLNDPGTYLSNWSGHLIRVPQDAVRQGRSPVIEILGTETLYVTKLSDDPFIPLTKARMIAADLDHAVNF
jgi:hypothetical protein